MTLIVVLCLIFVSCAYMDRRSHHLRIGYFTAKVASGLLLFLTLLAILTFRVDAITKRAEIAAIVETVQRARASNRDPLELAAINLKISEINAWIASAQYWNQNVVCDILFPDWVDDLRPVE